MEKISTTNPSLVLSGGGMKAAAFHIGVALALEAKGFSIGKPHELNQPLSFKRYVGSSAGSVIATFFAAGYSTQDIIFAFTQGKHNLKSLKISNLEPNKKLAPLRYKDVFSVHVNLNPSTWLPNFFSTKLLGSGGFESLIKKAFTINGFFSSKGIGDYFRENVFETEYTSFSELPMDLFTIATCLNNPKKVIFSKFNNESLSFPENPEVEYINGVDAATAITASAALPPIFTPVEINGEMYFDGEIRDSLSSHVALDQGSDLVIVSYSMQPYEYNEKIGSLDKYGVPVIANQALYQLIQQKITNHIDDRERLKNTFSSFEKELHKHLEKKEADKIVKRIESELFPSRHSKVIYINPSPQDHEMFFADHLSLKPKTLNKIVACGFRSAVSALKGYSFS